MLWEYLERFGRVERSFPSIRTGSSKSSGWPRITTMQAANEFLEKECWPDWNECFTKAPKGKEDLHRPLGEGRDRASALSHVESPVIANDYA